ncbi:MAG: RNA methyltransferase, TrmH family, group 3 [candidate division TM6 bacterium GW2011_GWF2_37_49]|nr:MAG: RNA methyltransferase, TrmH family, group 3 [candidate division TM6 bacterium GW2011_GWF2_37_49]
MKSSDNTVQGELIYGAHAIAELLRAKRRRIVSIYTTKPLPQGWERIKPYLPEKLPQIQYVSKNVLDKMVGTTDHNGVVAWVTQFKYQTKPFNPADKKFILLIDGVQDVRNVGAILRSAYCTGVQGVVLCKKGSSLLTAAAFKASAGLAEYLDIYVAPSASHAAQELASAGYNLYMAMLEGKNAYDVEYKAPMCLVIGNEATGISKNIQSLGQKITLPQRRPDVSYNASVAAGILLSLVSTKAKILEGLK